MGRCLRQNWRCERLKLGDSSKGETARLQVCGRKEEGMGGMGSMRKNNLKHRIPRAW